MIKTTCHNCASAVTVDYMGVCLPCFKNSLPMVDDEWLICFSFHASDTRLGISWAYDPFARTVILVKVKDIYENGNRNYSYMFPDTELFYIPLAFQKRAYTPWKKYTKQAKEIIANPDTERQYLAWKMK